MQRNLSQARLAHLIGVTQEAISRYECGKDSPSLGALAKLAQVLQTTTDYLLGRIEEPVDSPTPETFSEQERQVVTEFRQLSPKAQERAIGYLHGAKENQNKA